MELRLLLYGPETINHSAGPITPRDVDFLLRLKEQMTELMLFCQGRGLSAPQVGIPKRFVIVKLQSGEIIELINPEIKRLYGKEEYFPESCLSLPPYDNECRVPRTDCVDVEYGRIGSLVMHTRSFAREDARLVQHELDHLTGTFFVDRVPEKRRRPVLERFEAWHTSWVLRGRPQPYGGTYEAIARPCTADCG